MKTKFEQLLHLRKCYPGIYSLLEHHTCPNCIASIWYKTNCSEYHTCKECWEQSIKDTKKHIKELKKEAVQRREYVKNVRKTETI